MVSGHNFLLMYNQRLDRLTDYPFQRLRALLQDVARVAELRDHLEKSSDFQFTGQRLDFYGWCPNCANRRDRRSDTPAE